MLKLLHEHICVILTINLKAHYCFIYILWYEFMMTASKTSWRQNWGAITATWLCCHGCRFITVWWNCLIFEGLLQKWLILLFIILVSLYFVKCKSYEHSLIIYWTALVYKFVAFPIALLFVLNCYTIRRILLLPYCHTWIFMLPEKFRGSI